MRFPEFTDEWKEVPFASNLERLENGVNYNTNDKDGVPMSRIETISTGRIDYTKVGYCSTPQKIEHYIMRYGDILFSHINSLKHIGKTAYYSAEKPLYHGMNLLLFRCKNNIDSKFFFFLINNTHFIRKCQILAKQAVNQASISTSDLKKIKVYIPDINEQSKIQKFLSLIEKRIEVQNKIIEKLKTLIKGIIETVISSQKPNTLIKNCLKCNSSTLQESQVAENGVYPVYGAIGISGYTETANVNGESILIIKDGSGVGTVKFVDGEYSYIGTLNRLIAKEGYCLKYLYFTLQGFGFEPYKTGMAIPHIYFRDYGNAKIYCPPYTEQKHIADVLGELESKLFLEQDILASFNLQKRYLLGQIFI